MRILQINSVCGIGSTGRIASDLSEVLKDKGYDCLIAYGRGESVNNSDSVKFASNLDTNIHGLLNRFTDKHGFYSKKSTRKLINIIKGYNPDLINLHNIHGYYLNIELLFSFLAEYNKPVVWTLHDCWPFTGHCSYFEYIKCEKWRTACDNCPQKKEYPKSLFFDNSNSNFYARKELFTSLKNLTIITPSRWLGELVSQSFLNKYPVRVINNGIDLEAFKPTSGRFRQSYSLQDKYIILGVAAQWTKRKGLPILVELSELLEYNYKLVLVGLNQRELPDSKILCIPKTNDIAALAEIYTAADVFVNPTLEDNFPTTNLESLACGTPVITFDTGGSPESIDSSCGLVLAEKTARALQQGISHIQKMNIPESACIARAEMYDKYDRYKEYISLYHELLNL